MTDPSPPPVPGCASRPLRPATSMSGVPGRPSSTGSSPASRAAPSSCGSRTPTRSATAPSGPTASSPRWTGWACRPTRAPISSRPRTRPTRRPSTPSGRAARSTPATAPGRRSTSAPRRGRRPVTRPRATTATAGTSDCPGATGSALRFRTPDEGSTTVVDLVRGEVEFPHRATEDFICVKGERQAAVRAGQRGRRPEHGASPTSSGARNCSPPRPSRSCCGRP